MHDHPDRESFALRVANSAPLGQPLSTGSDFSSKRELEIAVVWYSRALVPISRQSEN